MGVGPLPLAVTPILLNEYLMQGRIKLTSAISRTSDANVIITQHDAYLLVLLGANGFLSQTTELKITRLSYKIARAGLEPATLSS